MSYKIRFNLGRGEHFMKWKVTSPEGCIDYYDPSSISIVMHDCKLRNQAGTAQKIHDGANKTVCAWIEAEDVYLVNKEQQVDWRNDLELSFNPRKTPHWVYTHEIGSIDNREIPIIMTQGRRLFDVAMLDCDE
jgi:hypothetical protein